MKTDYVDIWQLHNPSPDLVEPEDLITVMENVRNQGKVRHVSISSTLPHINAYIQENRFATYQIPYSGLQREHENAITQAAEAGCGTIIRGGVARGGPDADRAADNQWKTWDQAKLNELLGPGESPTAFLLRFTIAHPHMHTTIVGTANPDHLAANLAAAQDELLRVRAASSQSWMNSRRAQEVKALIQQVLADSDTRAALADGGMTGGYNGQNFFLASEDGNFLLRVSGQIQTRYAYNQAGRPIITNESPDLEFADSSGDPVPELLFDEDESFGDENVGGFEARRTKIRFDGHVVNPRLTYAVQLNALFGKFDDVWLDDNDPNGFARRDFSNGLPDVGVPTGETNGAVILEDAWVAYDLNENWNVKVGQFKAPFLREELVDSKYQLALERSLTADVLTVDYTQGVQISHITELNIQEGGTPVRVAGMIHDGSYQYGSAFNRDTTNFAFAGRIEILLDGTWDQFDDFQAWSTDDFGLMIGAAVDHEAGERGRNPRVLTYPDDTDEAIFFDNYDITKYTVDISVEVPDLSGLTIFAAYIGQDLDDHGSSSLLTGDASQHSFVVQAGAFILPDKWDVFVRYELLDFDGVILVNTPSQGGIDYPVVSPFADDVQILTFGTNYFLAGHDAKVGLDVVWVLDELPFNASPQNLRADADDDQVSLRAQLQLLF